MAAAAVTGWTEPIPRGGRGLRQQGGGWGRQRPCGHVWHSDLLGDRWGGKSGGGERQLWAWARLGPGTEGEAVRYFPQKNFQQLLLLARFLGQAD